MFQIKWSNHGKEWTVLRAKNHEEEKLIRFGLSRWLLRHRDPEKLVEKLPKLVEEEANRLKRYTIGWKDEQEKANDPASETANEEENKSGEG